MSFAAVLQELPTLSVRERQLIIRRALELDEQPLSSADEALVQERLNAHRQNPESSIALDEMKTRLRSRVSK